MTTVWDIPYVFEMYASADFGYTNYDCLAVINLQLIIRKIILPAVLSYSNLSCKAWATF